LVQRYLTHVNAAIDRLAPLPNASCQRGPI
jgi:hypothetical protein